MSTVGTEKEEALFETMRAAAVERSDPYTTSLVAFDVETTLYGNEDIGLAHPMARDNSVVLFGLFSREDEFKVFDYEHTLEFSKYLYSLLSNTTLCGHNISFDLTSTYRMIPKNYLQGYKIWDTQLAEYILTGQKTKFCSLDDLCVKYGLPIKDSKIKEYFEAGIGSDKIPRLELVPYLENDVRNTLAIAEIQIKAAIEGGFMPLILSQMEALHATIEMTYNGIYVDKNVLDKYTLEVVDKFVNTKLDLEEAIHKEVEDVNSPKQWSQFFFGGKKKITEKEEVGIYKNGRTKYKNVDKIIEIKPAIVYVPDPDKVSDKTGQVSVDEAVLSDMLLHTSDARLISIIKLLLEYRDLSKQLTTYVQGLSKHLIPDEIEKNFIHGKLNHTATVTGRLSSTSPNLQNISNNPIKKIFRSRFDDGFLIEVDFNQLEVVALAHVTRDKQLIEDISNGVDIHSALYKEMFHRIPTKEERKPFKARTFQLIYGAGPKAISKQAGCSLEEAKRFIDVFYKRYPGVLTWHTEFAARAAAESKHILRDDGLIDKAATFTYISETGRRFHFTEYQSDSTWSSRGYSFSPTELKNHPIQGLATGDIVPMMLGVLFRKFVGRKEVRMVNTIHDSVLFDVSKEEAVQFILDVMEVFRETDKYFLETFKVPLALKLNAGASFGLNWFEMEEAKI